MQGGVFDGGSKSIIGIRRFSSIAIEICQAGTICERIISNACHGIGEDDARQAGTIWERRPSNACHGIGEDDARQAGAT